MGGLGQRRLLGGTVIVDALDGATEAAVTYLAAAGVGTVVVRDRRSVATPGFLFETGDVGRPRLDAARERIARLNPDVVVASAASASGDGVSLPVCADLEAAARAALAVVRTLLCA
jgi:molybdopterin-synthase adenylyltransferase